MTDDHRTRLASGLAKIGMVIRHDARRDAGESGLTPTQAQILVTIDTSPDRRLTVGEIARSIAVTQPTASDAISALERKELVSRTRSEHDRRRVLIELTPTGRREARSDAAWSDVLLRAVDSLDDHEQGVFVKGLTKMIRSLQEDGRIPTARMCAGCTHFRPHAHDDPTTPHHCAFVDAPMRDNDLRLDCADFEPVENDSRLWQLFVGGRRPGGPGP